MAQKLSHSQNEAEFYNYRTKAGSTGHIRCNISHITTYDHLLTFARHAYYYCRMKYLRLAQDCTITHTPSVSYVIASKIPSLM